MQDFILKLGQSKAERLQSEFTMIHNETAYTIIREVGTEGFSMYYTLNSLAFGKTNVVIQPDNGDLSKLVGKCERTVQRWKEKLEAANIIRIAPCTNPKGLQVANVIIFNASYPEIPEGWDTFAPNGFIRVSEDQTPMLREEYEKMILDGMAVIQRKQHKSQPRQMCRPGGDRCVVPGVTDVSSLGVTDVSPSKSSKKPRQSKAESTSLIREDNKTDLKTVLKTTTKEGSVVVADLSQYFMERIGNAPDIENAIEIMLEDDKATEEDIRKAIDYTSERKPEKNVIGYVREVVRKRYWERTFTPSKQTTQTKTKEVRDERYANFYELFPNL